MSTKIPLPLISLNPDKHILGEKFNVEFEAVHSKWKPPVDVFDGDDVLVIEVDLPGIKEDDVALYLVDDILSIEGQRRGSDLSGSEVVQERGFGRFQRLIRLPTNIDSNKAQAALTNGVLRITFPKHGVTTLQPPQVVTGPKTEMDRNYEAYLRDKPQLEADFAGYVVAYFDGKRIAEGKDADDLLQNIPEQYRRKSLFIKDVSSSPVIFRRPFFMQGESA